MLGGLSPKPVLSTSSYCASETCPPSTESSSERWSSGRFLLALLIVSAVCLYPSFVLIWSGNLTGVVRVDILPTEFLPAVARDVANLVLGFAGDFLKVTVLLHEVLPTDMGFAFLFIFVI